MITWNELTKAYKAAVNATPSTTTLTVVIKTVEDINNEAVTLSIHDVRYWICYNVNRTNAIFVTESTATSSGLVTLTSECYIGSDLLAWAVNDVLVLYKCQGICDIDLGTIASAPTTSTFFKQGTSPHVRWLPTPELNKTNLYLGSSDKTPVMQYPLRIQKGANTITPSVIAGTDYKFNTENTWYVDLAEFMPECEALGSILDPVLSTGADVTKEIGEGIQVVLQPAPGSGSDKYHRRGYLTVLNRGIANSSFYEESDPVMKFFLSAAGATEADFELQVGLDLSRLSKTTAGLRLYVATKKDTDINSNLKLWADSPADYVAVPKLDYATAATLLISEHLFDNPGWGDMSKVATSRFVYTHTFFQSATQMGSALTETIVGNIGHAPDVKRTRSKPRFATRVARTQGNPIVIDTDDRTARLSCFGFAHFDDSFPDIQTDANGYRQEFHLRSEGDLMDLRFSLNQLLAMKRNWIEFIDTQASAVAGDFIKEGSSVIKADVCSRNGIVETPRGLFWRGHYGMYFKAHGSAEIQTISLPIQNYVDGSLLTADGTPYSQNSYREASVGGYDPFYKETWWNEKVNISSTQSEYINFRVHLPDSNEELTWWLRPINFGNGSIRWFTQRTNGTFLIGQESAILTYPNIESTYPYQDGVTYVDGASDRGIETKIVMNLGFINALPFGGSVYEVIIQCTGESSTGHEFFELKLSPEGNSLILTPHKIPIDGRFSVRPIKMPKIGSMRGGWLGLSLPIGLEEKYLKWDIYSITVFYIDTAIHPT